MDGLGDLLGRIKDSLDKDATTREIVAGCIREAAGFDVRLQDISIKGRVLRIKTSPVKKNEIKLREDKILSLVRERTKLSIETMSY
jgi:hypothetical protein